MILYDFDSINNAARERALTNVQKEERAVRTIKLTALAVVTAVAVQVAPEVLAVAAGIGLYRLWLSAIQEVC